VALAVVAQKTVSSTWACCLRLFPMVPFRWRRQRILRFRCNCGRCRFFPEPNFSIPWRRFRLHRCHPGKGSPGCRVFPASQRGPDTAISGGSASQSTPPVPGML